MRVLSFCCACSASGGGGRKTRRVALVVPQAEEGGGRRERGGAAGRQRAGVDPVSGGVFPRQGCIPHCEAVAAKPEVERILERFVKLGRWGERTCCFSIGVQLCYLYT